MACVLQVRPGLATRELDMFDWLASGLEAWVDKVACCESLPLHTPANQPTPSSKRGNQDQGIQTRAILAAKKYQNSHSLTFTQDQPSISNCTKRIQRGPKCFAVRLAGTKTFPPAIQNSTERAEEKGRKPQTASLARAELRCRASSNKPTPM